MTEMMRYVLYAYVGSTWAMFGIIWFAQIVHYPLFSKVGQDKFSDYQNSNLIRTVFVVIPLQMVEICTAMLLAWKPPEGILPIQVWTSIILIGITWISTLTLQVPRHRQLARGFDQKTQKILVSSNWIRTIAWSLRSAIVVWMLHTMLSF